MAVLVEALSVILRRDAIARRYDGGWSGFVADTVNGTLCADSEIARVGFMHPHDVGAFVRRMERHGFVFQGLSGAAVDIVVVDQQEGPTTPCAWIEFFHEEVPGGSVAAARLKDSRDETLTCPDGWEFERSLSHEFGFYPGTNPTDRLEFVRHEGSIDVYRDPQTGKEMFLGRPQAFDGAEAEDTESSFEALRAEHDELMEEAVKLLAPFFEPGTRPTSADDVACVARACDALERVVTLHSENWNAWWGLGMARRLLQDHERAYAAFARAYGINPNEIEVGRNLAAECIHLGYGAEAVEVSLAVVRLAPQDAGLIANHAMALLISGDADGAWREGIRALQLSPEDQITLSLLAFIDQVRSGRIEAPRKLATW